MLTLAYDGGRTFCTETAKSIEKIANSKSPFSIVSLDEAWVKDLLNQNGLDFQPVILERSDDGWKVHRGIKLAMKLVAALGPATSWAILKSIGQLRTSRANGPSRIKFLAGLAGLATVTALPSPAYADSGDSKDTPEWLSVKGSDPESLDAAEADRVANEFFDSAPGRKAESVFKDAVSHPDLAAVGPMSDDASITGSKFPSQNGETTSVVLRHPQAAFIYFVNVSEAGKREYATVITPPLRVVAKLAKQPKNCLNSQTENFGNGLATTGRSKGKSGTKLERTAPRPHNVPGAAITANAYPSTSNALPTAAWVARFLAAPHTPALPASEGSAPLVLPYRVAAQKSSVSLAQHRPAIDPKEQIPSPWMKL